MSCLRHVCTFPQAPDRGLPAPDAVIYLELSVEDAMARGGFGGERYERARPSCLPSFLRGLCLDPARGRIRAASSALKRG